jgi:hypothetical protein
LKRWRLVQVVVNEEHGPRPGQRGVDTGLMGSQGLDVRAFSLDLRLPGADWLRLFSRWLSLPVLMISQPMGDT